MAVVTELVTKFGFEGSTAPLADYNKALGAAVKGLAGFAAATGAALVAGAGVLGVINQETAQMSSLAEAVGLSTRSFQAYGAVAKQIGLDSEVVVDLVEEMNNKFGESADLVSKGEKPLAAVSDALGILGVEYKDLASLNPEEQFRAISKAIEDMPDAQQAASAADILFGGEANKFFSQLKQTGQSLDSIAAKYEAINFLTKDGTEGAKQYTQSLSDMGMLFSSVGREISGIIGGQLSPELESLTEGFSDLVRENKDWVIGVASKTAEIAVALGKTLVRLSPIIIGLAGAWGILTLATGGFATIMAVVTSPVTIFIALGAAVLLMIDDLIVAFQGGESVIANFAQSFLGIDIVPGLQAMVDGVMWAVDQIVDGFQSWFDFFAAGWAKYQGIIETVSGLFGSGGDAEIKVTGEGSGSMSGAGVASAVGGVVQQNTNNDFSRNNNTTIQNDMTRAGGAIGSSVSAGTTNNNKVENTTSITIQATNALEAKQGVDNALQDQMRNTETALNRID